MNNYSQKLCNRWVGYEVWAEAPDGELYRFATFNTRAEAYECAERCYEQHDIVQIHEVEHL